MTSTVKSCTLFTIPLLVLVLAAPADATTGFSRAESFWSWLLRWVTTSPADGGPMIDPDGAAGQLDTGPEIDPNGGNG